MKKLFHLFSMGILCVFSATVFAKDIINVSPKTIPYNNLQEIYNYKILLNDDNKLSTIPENSNTVKTQNSNPIIASETLADNAATPATTVLHLASSDTQSVSDVAARMTYTAPGGVSRSIANKLSDITSVLDFGATGNGTTDDTAAFNLALKHAHDIGGATILIPSGTYKISSTLVIRPIKGGYHRIILKGETPASTILDFSSCKTDGIQVKNWGGIFGFSSLTVKGAGGVGININPVQRGDTTSYISQFYLHDIIVHSCGSDGIKECQTYMGDHQRVLSYGNGGHGFNLIGYHTSLSFIRCWAGGGSGGNKGSGWNVNGIVYSSFISCAGDWNTYGWHISNTSSVQWIGCGAESNKREGFFVTSSTNDSANLPTVCIGINATIFNTCFAAHNSRQDANAFCNFMRVDASNSKAVHMSISGCSDISSRGTTQSIRFSAEQGQIYATLNNNNFFGSITSTGTGAFIKNLENAGRFFTVWLNSKNQSIPSGVATKVAFSADYLKNINMKLNADGGIVIPNGVHFVRITSGVYWDKGTTGSRQLRIAMNDAIMGGIGLSKIQGVDYASQNISSSVVPVSPGQVISAYVFQNSGAALNIIGNGNTFLSIEIIG